MKVLAPTLGSMVAAIKTCIQCRLGKEGNAVHTQIIKLGFLPQTSLYNYLISMYRESSNYIYARKVFDEMPSRDLVSFGTLISGYCRSGTPKLALALASDLQGAALTPNNYVFSGLIKACSRLLAVDQGKQLHAQVVVLDLESSPFVRTALIDMYSSFDDLASFNSIIGHGLDRDLVMYNSVLSGFVRFGYFEDALKLFVEARRDFGLEPSEFTFGTVVKASTSLGREVGEQIHLISMKMGLDFDCFVGTSLVDMYGRFGDIESSEKVFRNISSVDIALYNAMIVGCSQNGLDASVLQYYQELKSEGLTPNEVTFSSILGACSSLKQMKEGKVLHGIVQKSEFQRDLAVNSALIDMYMKCGCVRESWIVFRSTPKRSTVSYNAMICGLGQSGKVDEAVGLFVDMNCQSVEPDHATFIVLMNSCLGYERGVYTHAIKRGFGLDSMVQNSLLDGLIKAGSIEEAQELFYKMDQRTVVSWTIIISGLSQLGLDSDAVELFRSMQLAGVRPNCFTISCILKACGNLADLDQGRCIHACSIKHGTDDDDFTSSSLLDMYANCGALGDSYKVFDELPKKDVVSWNTMITGCGRHGHGTEALKLFGEMENYGVRPNNVTFLSLLTACSHSGLVDEGVRIFEGVMQKYDIKPSMEHYACVADMYGRVGMLDRVKRLIEEMPFEPDISVWRTALAASKLHGDIDLAKFAGDHVLGTGDQDKVSFVTMHNLLSTTRKWDEAEKMRERMRDQGLRKDPGISWVKIKSNLLVDESVSM